MHLFAVIHPPVRINDASDHFAAGETLHQTIKLFSRILLVTDPSTSYNLNVFHSSGGIAKKYD